MKYDSFSGTLRSKLFGELEVAYDGGSFLTLGPLTIDDAQKIVRALEDRMLTVLNTETEEEEEK